MKYDEKFVGNITTRGEIRSDFGQYWNQISPENEGKWASVEPQQNNYRWESLDAIYSYAEDNYMPFKEQPLVWGSQVQSWLDRLEDDGIAAEIEEWMQEFCSRYPNTALIDVVYEATPGHLPSEVAKRAFGDDWIIRAFELAHQHCPKSVLLLTDYGVLSGNTAEFIDMATPAVNAGVVDALGLEAHGLEKVTLADIEARLNQVLALGLPVYITEYDVDIENDAAQLEVMQSQFPLFYTHPNVVGITLWGYVERMTWAAHAGLIYQDGTKRPAMTWLMDYLGR
ncbi:MAG: endo-1,4-beta-xylanase [Deltaproteobacteria bacterium]|nr:endo-1,4-beta-xylanase [Deltaproteobacteria bacterium]